MKNYLDLLPDGIYRLVVEYMYADTLQELIKAVPKTFDTGVTCQWSSVLLLQNKSDWVRSQSLNNSYRRGIRDYWLSDWYKLLIDMESPTASSCAEVHALTINLLKVNAVFDISPGRSFWWSSCIGPKLLTLAGWYRLTEGTELVDQSHRLHRF
tara:strand:+ start:101 stop:562 length:462 start_codon:yes stop_codon:yes gene_type:complete